MSGGNVVFLELLQMKNKSKVHNKCGKRLSKDPFDGMSGGKIDY